DWTVVLISRQKPKQEVSYLIDGKSVAIGITERTAQESSSGDGYYHLIKSHLISPEHEFIDLDPTQRGEAIKLTALKRTADQIQGEHLKNPIPELAGLDNDAQKATLMQLAEARIAAGQGVIPDYPNGELVRNNIRSKQKPLLLLYNLDPEKAKLPADGPPIAGFAISFPASAFDEAISFAVHEQLVSFLNQQDTVDNDEDADED
ncbi:MAG: hypothetical protein LH609_07735, partial [Rudanella sp.]|nr:hypothetical protein [Rudanella sp.]